MDLAYLQQWIGREELTIDRANPAAARALLATLDRVDLLAAASVEMPLTAHWLHFHAAVPQSEIGPDGHAKRGGFLPPVPLPRRMWAGSRLAFSRRMRSGETIERRSSVSDVRATEGRSGALVFVKVKHEIGGDNGIVLVEEQDIVYRDQAPAAGGSARAPRRSEHSAQWRRTVTPDPVLLFRYSALTFNGHRIHYDHPYVTKVEGYDGLIVHGPLIATLLLDLLERERPQAIVREFAFRAVAPLTDTAPFFVCGTNGANSVNLWAEDESGALAMEATATLEPA
jgi:3-methylfumaryl-CoA hydratase